MLSRNSLRLDISRKGYEMKNSKKLILILMFLAIAIVAVPLLLNHADFGGTDGAAEKAIAVIDPNYVQWAKPIIKLPGG